jgi:endogenous inhibitor of DNA gyrase (YacG/DUF329 family)
MKGRCPTCRKPYEIQALADLPTFPFCSERCRLIDLGRWIDGAHVIPGPDIPPQPAPGTEPDPEEE